MFALLRLAGGRVGMRGWREGRVNVEQKEYKILLAILHPVCWGGKFSMGYRFNLVLVAANKTFLILIRKNFRSVMISFSTSRIMHSAGTRGK